MLRLKRRGKSILVKVTAAVTAVLISPFLARLAGSQSDALASLWQQEAEAVSADKAAADSPMLEMNGSALLMYSPYGNGEVAIEQLIINNEQLTIDEEPSFSGEPAAQVLSYNIAEIEEDAPVFTEVDGRIVRQNFGPNDGTKFLNLELAGQVRNETGLNNDTVSAEAAKFPEIKLELNGEPEVLIFHTHTTEAFQPDGYDYFDASYYGRSLDASRNIVAVGARIATAFAEAGITVIHDGTLHDYPKYSGAYERSAETVRQILQAYPSVKIVLDIHRDAIDDGDARIAAVAQADDRDAAQVMIISAADDGTYNIPNYMQNFRLAALFQQHMEHDTPGITRPVLFQYCQYNQHITTGSLLIEVGAYGNTLEQAMYAGQLIGKSMAEALLQLTINNQ